MVPTEREDFDRQKIGADPIIYPLDSSSGIRPSIMAGFWIVKILSYFGQFSLDGLPACFCFGQDKCFFKILD
jgi:hypothetical protein